jgi:UDP-N-acetylmuramoyl-L-alanyl-D-glutamate--2,6-diaminopimelate ligase
MQLDNIVFSKNSLLHALARIDVALGAIDIHADHLDGINNISLDSRCANAATIFVALQGTHANGHDYIDDAISRGCKLVLCEHTTKVQSDMAQVITVTKLRVRLPEILKALYLQSAAKVQVTAVTGTNGKTSVAYLYAQLALSSASASASLGTLGLRKCAKISSENASHKHAEHISIESLCDSINTTPDIISQFKVLALLAEQNILHYCLEASSHGIEQKRLEGMPINCAIFTNLSQDHLDYHGDMASYGSAKRALLKNEEIQYVVINADDPESVKWHQDASSTVKIAWFSIEDHQDVKDRDYFAQAKNIQASAKGISFDLHSTWGERRVHLPLLGRFNVANFLAALCAHLMQGLNLDSLLGITPLIKGVPGRMELFSTRAEKANFIVDYAHTPDALCQALKAARMHTSGQLVCVFGCGGNRDVTKRPLMGQAASQYSDMIVLTQDNSRDEAPELIIDDIKKGLNDSARVHVELDRKEAIRWAWNNSKKADLILLAGKGHEDYVEIKQQRIAYDERAYAAQICAEVAL